MRTTTESDCPRGKASFVCDSTRPHVLHCGFNTPWHSTIQIAITRRAGKNLAPEVGTKAGIPEDTMWRLLGMFGLAKRRKYRQKQHHNGPNYVVNLQEAWERRDHSLMWRLQLIPHRRPRNHWPLMIRANLELLFGGVTMAPRDAVAWDVDAIMPALRDPDRRIPLQGSGEMEFHARRQHFGSRCERGRIEKVWTQTQQLRSRMRRYEDGKLSAIDNSAGKRWLRRTIQTHC